MEHPDRLTAVEARASSNTHRIDNLEKRQDNLEKLTANVAVMATKQEAMEQDVKEIKTDVKGLAAIPANRWNEIIKYVATAIVGAAITYAAAQIFG